MLPAQAAADTFIGAVANTSLDAAMFCLFYVNAHRHAVVLIGLLAERDLHTVEQSCLDQIELGCAKSLRRHSPARLPFEQAPDITRFDLFIAANRRFAKRHPWPRLEAKGDVHLLGAMIDHGFALADHGKSVALVFQRFQKLGFSIDNVQGAYALAGLDAKPPRGGQIEIGLCLRIELDPDSLVPVRWGLGRSGR